jgi:Tfp pilus assembly protein PilO
MNKNISLDAKTLLIVMLALITVGLVVLTGLDIRNFYLMRGLISEQEALADSYRSQIAELRAIQAKQTSIDYLMAQATTKIPTAPDEPGVIDFISETVGDGALRSITFAERFQNNVANEMPATISLKCTYPKLISILDTLTTAERLYTVSKVSISSPETGDELSVTLSVSTYFR